MKKMVGKGFAEMMVYTCDGCGVEERGMRFRETWIKPPSWYAREDEDGEQVACSKECIKKVAAKSGKTDVVMPSFI